MTPQGRPEDTSTQSKAGVAYDEVPREGTPTTDKGIRADEFSNGRKEPSGGLPLPDQRGSKGGARDQSERSTHHTDAQHPLPAKKRE